MSHIRSGTLEVGQIAWVLKDEQGQEGCRGGRSFRDKGEAGRELLTG